MSTITTRAGKGSPLTNTEMDNNLTNLNTDKLQSGDTAASLTITSADINGGTIDGTAIGGTTPSTAAFTETVITASGSTAALRVTNTGTGNSLLIEDSSNPDSSPFVIDAAGNIIQGYTANITSNAFQANNSNPFSGIRWNAAATGPTITIGKSRSATIGTNGIVSSGDTLGTIAFAGDDGANFIQAASILSAVDGTPGTTDMPGRLTFLTTADGAFTPTERMRIDNAGNVGIGGTAGSTFKLDVIGNSSSNAVQLRAINNDTSGTSASSLVAQNGSGTVVQLQTYGTDAILNVSSNNPLAFRTNNTERMRIDTSGVVTIAGDLAVNGSTSADITTTTTTASLFNATATTVNIGSAATTISIGNTLHSGTTTVQHDLYVHGNITFGAGASTLSATTISIDDTLISLADANTADILDIGFYAGYQPASTALHTGLVRDASDSVWKLFSGISAQPTTTVDFTGATYAPLRIGALTATDGTFSGVITASAGTNTAPAITTTGDINTGIFFPAADTIAFTEGGNEAMRIDSAGNVGIGTTSPANKFEVNGDGIRNTARASTTAGQVLIEAQASNYWSVPTYTGTSLRQSGSTATGTYAGLSNANLGSLIFQNGSAGLIGTNGGTPIVIATAETERMRIHSTGGVSIGNTTDPGATNLSVTGTISLNNGTSNLILYNANGVAAPAFTTRSAGAKLVLFPNIGASNSDYALGIESNTLWFGVDQVASRQFRWYGGTTLAATLTGAGALTTVSTISDGHGNVRSAILNSQTTGYTTTAADNGKTVIVTGGVTIGVSVHSNGDIITIFNNSASAITITTTSLTVYLAGTASTGNRTLAQRGLATIVCVATNTFAISGAGLT